MEENLNMNKIPKLKLLKLNSLLDDKNIRYKNINKTERNYPRLKPKLTFHNNQFLSLNTQRNVFSKFQINNQKPNYETIKRKTIKSYKHFSTTKKRNNYNINTINNNGGYNNYLKLKLNRAYINMNRLLMEENIKRLSLPKFRKTKVQKFMKKEKSNFSNDKKIFEVEFEDDADKKLTIEKKHKARISLFEKEKIKSREKFIFSLKKNFKELDSCEKKFDTVINKTLKLLSFYGTSLSNLKTEEQ